MSKYVLVLGSKPESKLPNIEVKKIYSANGAAERALKYKQKYHNVEHVALIGAKEFEQNQNVSNRVIFSRPDKLIVRMGKINIPSALKQTKEIIYTDQLEQYNFQSKFYKLGKIDLIFGETFFYELNPYKMLKHLLMCLRFRGFLGASTGFYSILLALFENPDCDVIVSGIGLVEGGHYYTSKDSYGFISKTTTDMIKSKKMALDNKFRNTSRCRVERFLINRVKEKFKKRIISTDDTMVYHGKLKKWNNDLF
tara:strand:- start:418 stop:1176 length:759 start_codon:yes stop_codon:yes gene_type:complete